MFNGVFAVQPTYRGLVPGEPVAAGSGDPQSGSPKRSEHSVSENGASLKFFLSAGGVGDKIRKGVVYSSKEGWGTPIISCYHARKVILEWFDERRCILIELFSDVPSDGLGKFTAPVQMHGKARRWGSAEKACATLSRVGGMAPPCHGLANQLAWITTVAVELAGTKQKMCGANGWLLFPRRAAVNAITLIRQGIERNLERERDSLAPTWVIFSGGLVVTSS